MYIFNKIYILIAFNIMADKVDQIMEYMLDEFNFYQKEKLFSINEIRKIVKIRRSHEYQMFRKDAQLIYFIDAI